MEVVMKSIIRITIVAFIGVMAASCSSSMQMSRSSSGSDDVFYTPGKSSVVVVNQQQPEKQVKTDDKFTNLDKKYTEILAKSEDVDTVIYKSEEKYNPYESVLSDSYEESYERRLRGRSSITYRLHTIRPYYSDAYWYAQAYDPYYYNVIVMGDEVWVEPFYVSAMFGWHRPHYSYGYGFGYGWNYWNYGYGYGYPWYSSWGYGNSYWNGYAWGYNNGYHDGYYWNNQINNPSYYNYGPRPGTDAVSAGGSVRPNQVNSSGNVNDRIRSLEERQPVLGNEGARTRNPQTQQDIATRPSRENDRLTGSSDAATGNPNVTTRPAREVSTGNLTREPNVVTRPIREVTNDNLTRTRPTGNEPSRESYQPSYTRPKPANSNEYNRPARTVSPSEPTRINTERDRQPNVAPNSQPSSRPSNNVTPPTRNVTPSSTPHRDSRPSNSEISRPSSPSNSAPSRTSSPSSSAPSRTSSGNSSNSGNSNNRTRH